MRKRTAEGDGNASAPPQTERQFINSLHRGLEVLRAFRPEDRAGLSNGDLAERTGLPNSTVSRLTYTLLQTGYLTYDSHTGRYRMGVPVLSLGYACLSGISVREAAQTYMQDLADSCGEGVLVALGGRDARTMTYLACARSRSVITLQLGVGSRISLGRSAMGRAYIAACPEDERQRIMAELKRRYDKDAWPALRDGIRDAAVQIADRGFYANFGEWQPDVNAIAVPFVGRRSDPLLCFNLGGPSTYLARDRLERELGPKLVELARTMARQVGSQAE